VVDVRMPGTGGIELVREARRRGIDLPIILMSGHADVPMAVEGIKAGAEDFIQKPPDDAQLIAAINRGLIHATERESAHRAVEELAAGFARLTPRQVELFNFVVAGYTSHAIAEKLHISPRTVESYRTAVMEKMRAESVAILVRQAIQLGCLTP
jgi:two-component system, LuxR family, response regulator FixJ